MKKLFLFTLLLVFVFVSRGQTGVPGNGNALTVYVEKVGSFNLRVSDRRTYSQQVNLSYSSGLIEYVCVVEMLDDFFFVNPEVLRNTVSRTSCGSYTITYTRPFSVTVPSGNGVSVAYEVNYNKNTPSYDRPLSESYGSSSCDQSIGNRRAGDRFPGPN